MTTWKPIPGYEGYYESSDEGQVRSVSRMTIRNRWMEGRLLALTPNSAGYLAFAASRDGNKTTMFVHQAVMLAHKGSRPDGMVVRHLDGNPLNNRLSNLAWGTVAENNQDAVKHGTNAYVSRTHCPQGHAYAGANLIVRKRGEGRTSRQCRECENARMRRDNARRVELNRKRRQRLRAERGAA